jgi:hypothetical protein
VNGYWQSLEISTPAIGFAYPMLRSVMWKVGSRSGVAVGDVGAHYRSVQRWLFARVILSLAM